MSGKTEANINISTDFDMDSILGPDVSAEPSPETKAEAPKANSNPHNLEAQTQKPGDAPSKETPYDKSVRVAKERAEKDAKKAEKKAAKAVTSPTSAPEAIIPEVPGQLDLPTATIKTEVKAVEPESKCQSAFTSTDVKYIKDGLVTVGLRLTDINENLKAIAATNAETLKLYKESCEFQAKAILEVIAKVTQAIDTHNSKVIAVPVATTVATEAASETAPKAKSIEPATVTLDMLKTTITDIVAEGIVQKKQAVMAFLESMNAKPITSASPEQYVQLFNGLQKIKNGK